MWNAGGAYTCSDSPKGRAERRYVRTENEYKLKDHAMFVAPADTAIICPQTTAVPV